MFTSQAGLPSEFRHDYCCHKQVLKSSLCRMDQYLYSKLVVMHCAETRSVRILIGANSRLLYGIRFDILHDLCKHAYVNFDISHKLIQPPSQLQRDCPEKNLYGASVH